LVFLDGNDWLNWLKIKKMGADNTFGETNFNTGIIRANPGDISSVANGWGENSTFYQVGGYCSHIKINKIELEIKILGAGYYNNLTINCYVGWGEDKTRLFEINDGPGVEIRYFT
jgi:hypothetical protein